MVLEQQILPYFQWLLTGGDGDALGALPRFLLVFLGLSLAGLVIGFAISASRYGFMRGGDVTYHTIAGGLRELWDTTPRRVWAIARLAVKESWRRRVIVALVVFLVVLLFASWFLHTNHRQPARLYLSFVIATSTFLVLGVGWLLSAFSLPNDFKSKTIYTVVTKPVRAGEIILGRIIGFAIVATALLAVMGLVSYVFVVRSLDHTHRLTAADLTRQETADGAVLEGQTSIEDGHSHQVTIDERALDEGDFVETDLMNGHTHEIRRDGDAFRVSGPIGFLQARVPKYGKLRFIDRSGAAKDRGISVGSEWTYRSFIDGNTPATAIWTFDGVNEAIDAGQPADERMLRVALIVRVFRTHKGIVGQALQGTLQLRNPRTDTTSQPIIFDALDQQVREFNIPRKVLSTADQEIDVFDDLVSDDGQIEVRVQCVDRGQYFGFAQADCYLRLPDGSPIVSLAKVYVSIWVQAIIVIAVGVTISTLVSGPVAMLFTSAFIILGFYREKFLDIATGNVYGGGPAESVVRIANQSNMMTALDEGIGTTLVLGFDQFIARPIMWCIGQCLPDFSALSTAKFAAEGYNVPWDRVFQDATTAVGYVVALSILGFFLLRTREIAR
jgi:hypothetical protein